MNRSRSSAGPLPLLAAVLALSGCATWSAHGVALRPPTKLRLAVLPVGLDFKERSLARIETIPKGAGLKKLSKRERQRLVDRKMAANLAWLRHRFEERLSASYAYEVVADSAVLSALPLEGLDPAANLWKLKPEKAKALARRLNADVILKTKLYGYGAIKLSWFLTFMAVDYLQDGIGGFLVAQGSGNTWAGLATGGIWAAADTINYTTAMFFLNRVFTPVILRADLLSGSDGKTLSWSTEFEMNREPLPFVHNKAFDKYPKEMRKLRQTRLRVVAEKAVEDLGAYFEGEAFKNAGISKGWFSFFD